MKKQITPLILIAATLAALCQTAAATPVPDAASTSAMATVAVGGLFVLRRFLK